MRIGQIRTEELGLLFEGGARLHPMPMLVAAQATTCRPVQVTITLLFTEQVMERNAVDGDIAERGEELRVGEE